ncbi:MAG TPA: hypothetical protein VFX71_03935, partial [Hyphomicrobium sp.]|nr:hypothetical protein [Hyphomicrobium sp.]
MTVDLCRIRAVAASLRGIRERVTDHEDVHYWNTTPFDNAVGLLADAIEGADFTSHTLDETEINRTDYLVHLDGLIAFLEVYEQQGQASGNVVNLV